MDNQKPNAIMYKRLCRNPSAKNTREHTKWMKSDRIKKIELHREKETLRK